MILKQRQLVFDPLLNTEPVKRMKHRSDVGVSGCSENESHRGVIFHHNWQHLQQVSIILLQVYM